jgi:hypothetical protein
MEIDFSLRKQYAGKPVLRIEPPALLFVKPFQGLDYWGLLTQGGAPAFRQFTYPGLWDQTLSGLRSLDSKEPYFLNKRQSLFEIHSQGDPGNEKKRTSNIEHRTSNIEGRKIYFTF